MKYNILSVSIIIICFISFLKIIWRRYGFEGLVNEYEYDRVPDVKKSTYIQY